jgi:hypothetical protein
MTKYLLHIILILFFSFQLIAQNFGDFASGIFINNCGNSQFYNTSGSGDNCINPNCATVFNGVNFGSFNQNSGALAIRGGEIKTWKNGGGNVCSARLNFIVYPTGSRPATPTFTVMNLPFKANCNSGTFEDGLGPCGGSDQKWSTEVYGPENLTTLAPGDYTIEVYYDYVGDDNSNSQCRDTKYINNGNNPTNYTATFSIVASGGACTILPIVLDSFSAECIDDKVKLNWTTISEVNNDYFLIESTNDGINWVFEDRIQGQFHSLSETKYEKVLEKKNDTKYFRLSQIDIDGKKNIVSIIKLDCSSTDRIFSYPNPSGNSFTLYINHKAFKGQNDLKIYDLKGALVDSNHLTINSGLNQFVIEKILASGMYYLILENEQGEIYNFKHTVLK